mgnify:CR=1 FL=1
MTATMKLMDNYVFADYLTPDQLMEGDFIKITDEYGEQIVEVKNIYALDEGYMIEAINDYQEDIDVPALDTTRFEWYVIKESD